VGWIANKRKNRAKDGKHEEPKQPPPDPDPSP